MKTGTNRTTCCGDGKGWGRDGLARDCSANDLFGISIGTQCGNCGAVRISPSGSPLEYSKARALLNAVEIDGNRERGEK